MMSLAPELIELQVGFPEGGDGARVGFVCEHPSSLPRAKSSIAATKALPQFGSLQVASSQHHLQERYARSKERFGRWSYKAPFVALLKKEQISWDQQSCVLDSESVDSLHRQEVGEIYYAFPRAAPEHPAPHLTLDEPDVLAVRMNVTVPSVAAILPTIDWVGSKVTPYNPYVGTRLFGGICPLGQSRRSHLQTGY